MTAFPDSPAVLRPSATEQAFWWFHRIIAGYCMLFGLLYWVRLVGVYDGPLWRFDLMPVHWQVAAVTLAVAYPIAGIGLWMLTSWGPVIWAICAIAEATMYLGFPNLFGEKTLMVAAHGCVALLYAVFRAVLFFQRRAAR